MIEITVNNCLNCPFRYSEYDDHSMGYDTLDICVLAHFNGTRSNIIKAYDSYRVKRNYRLRSYNTPKWCPLGEIIIKKV